MSPKSGTFSTYISKLRTAGYIEKEGTLIFATDVGLGVAGSGFVVPTTPEELLEMWCNSVGAASKLLRVVAEVYPDIITREELAERLDMSKGSGTFSTYLSKLRANGLITVTGQNLRAGESLFEL